MIHLSFYINPKVLQYPLTSKGPLNSERIYEVIVSPKMPTKNFKDFCPGSLLEGKVEILKDFGRLEKTHGL